MQNQAERWHFPIPVRCQSERDRELKIQCRQRCDSDCWEGCAGDWSVPDRDPLIFSLISLVYPLEPGSGTAHWEAEERKRPIWKAREEEEGERQRETQPTLWLPPASF